MIKVSKDEGVHIASKAGVTRDLAGRLYFDREGDLFLVALNEEGDGIDLVYVGDSRPQVGFYVSYPLRPAEAGTTVTITAE